jgi:hypothetical protein
LRILLYEHVTGGDLAGAPLPASLLREGRAMLLALAHLRDPLRAGSAKPGAAPYRPASGLGRCMQRIP